MSKLPHTPQCNAIFITDRRKIKDRDNSKKGIEKPENKVLIKENTKTKSEILSSVNLGSFV